MSMEQASKRCNALETSHAWPSPARDTSGAAWAGVQNWMERASTAAAAAASSTRLPSCRGTPLGTPNGGSHALNGRCAAQQHRTEPANVRAAGPHREPGGAHPVEGRRGRGSFGAMPWMPWSPAQRPLPEAHRASHYPVVPSASGRPAHRRRNARRWKLEHAMPRTAIISGDSATPPPSRRPFLHT